MEKGQIIDIRIEDMLDDGRAFGRYDGCAVFISGSAVPGDRVSAKVTKAKKTSAEASVTDILEPSENRIKAECPYFRECGGCSLQELSYDAQKKLKTEQVRAKLKRLGGLDDPKVNDMIGADTLKYYRNKAVFAVGPHGEVGFNKGKSHYVVDIEDCMLQTDAAMVCADALRVFLRRTGVSCIKQMTVKTAFGTGEVMVVLESENKEIRDIDELVGMFDAAVYSLSPAALEEGVAYETGEETLGADDFEPAVLYSLESVAVIHKGKCRIIAGKPTITEKVTRSDGKELSYEISPQSFYQVNPEQMPKLYDKAMEYAALTGKETLLDLYCGVGTIGIWMADKAEKVIGIESVKPAVIDANRNSVINNIINTRYICGKAEEELPGMMGLAKLWKWNEVNERVERKPEITIEHADVAVLDPPRAGCEEALLEAVVKAAPDRIVYVSCDPGTLARDIKYLSANGYEFIECTPVDQFPWTSHIETVCLLSQRKPDTTIEVDLDISELEVSSAETKATYEEIKSYVLEKYGLKVSNLYIAQVKRECGIVERINYNLPKTEGNRVPQCPEDKRKAIKDAFIHFQMI